MLSRWPLGTGIRRARAVWCEEALTERTMVPEPSLSPLTQWRFLGECSRQRRAETQKGRLDRPVFPGVSCFNRRVPVGVCRRQGARLRAAARHPTMGLCEPKKKILEKGCR